MAALTLRVAAALLLTLYSLAGHPAAQESGLYAQATGAMLDRDFPSRDVNYLLLDLQTRRVIALRWPHADLPVPVGSLLKPFVAMAYAESRKGKVNTGAEDSDTFPTVVCHGKRDGCWRTGGHGSLHLERALAESCNAYFLTLARTLASSDGGPVSGEDALRQVTQSYGLPAPPYRSIRKGSAGASDDLAKAAAMLIGTTPEWRMRPADLAQAYALLATGSPNAVTARLLTGMRLASLQGGTAAYVGMHAGGVLAKTGTAPCVPLTTAEEDRCRVNGDGLVVAMTPVEHPRTLLLVRKRGTTGAMAAQLAGEMLTRIEEAHAAH